MIRDGFGLKISFKNNCKKSNYSVNVSKKNNAILIYKVGKQKRRKLCGFAGFYF